MKFSGRSFVFLAAIQAQVAAGQLSQQATMYAQQSATGLNTRGGDFCLGDFHSEKFLLICL